MLGSKLLKTVLVGFLCWQSGVFEACGASSRPICSVNTNPHVPSKVNFKDRGGLNSLVESARSTRENVFHDQLPYSGISAEISRAYNLSVLDTSPFIILWLKYSENALYLAGFILLVSLVFPGVMVALWTFWECCYEVDEEEEDDNRNLSLKAQVIAWSIALALLFLLLVLSVFVFIILSGNTWISNGVNDGSQAVSTLLPELVRIKRQSLKKVERVVLDDYELLERQIYGEILQNVPSQASLEIQASYQGEVNELYNNITTELSKRDILYQAALTLVEFNEKVAQNMSSVFNIQVETLNNATLEIANFCEVLSSSGSGLLFESCASISSARDSYLLSIVTVGGVDSEDVSVVKRVMGTLDDPVFSEDMQVNQFDVYLNELASNLTLCINKTSEAYFGSNSTLYGNMTSFVTNLLHDYNTTLTLGWPQSQEQLEEYLGPRNLANWDHIRSACTVTFVLVVILLGVCLVVAMVRGLYHIATIYKSGDSEMTNIEGAHQAGTMLKKLTLCFCGVCFVSAVFFGFFVCVSGVLGRSCDSKNDFSHLIDNVIDVQASWNDSYPLGWALLGDRTQRVAVSEVLDRCEQGHSLYMVFDLDRRYPLDEFCISQSDREGYREQMRAIFSTISHSSLLSPTIQHQLSLLTTSIPSLQSQLSILNSPNDLFQENFVGLATLKGTYSRIRTELANINITSDQEQMLNTLLDTADSALDDLTISVTTQLFPPLRNSSITLSTTTVTDLSSRVESFQRKLDAGAMEKVDNRIVSATLRVNANLSDFLSTTRHSLVCEMGTCRSIAAKYRQFSSALCTDIVPGMDVYWVSLLVVVSISLVVIPSSLFLASRFIDLELEKSNRNMKFHLTSTVIRQSRAVFWILLSISVNLALVVTMSRDEYFHSVCVGSCCARCVWVFGILFVISAALIGGGTRMYQCILLYRIKKCVHAKVRRYWMDRKKATQFYAQLLQLIFQDIPFLILAGVYGDRINTLNVTAFFSITVSLIGIISYLIYLLVERNNILTYFQCLKAEFHNHVKFGTQPSELPMGNGVVPGGTQLTTMNGRHRRGHYGSSESEQSEDDSQGTTQPDNEWRYNASGGAGEHRLSVIPEYSETLEHPVPMSHDLEGTPPPPISLLPRGMTTHVVPVHIHHDSDTENELSQVRPASPVMLGNLDQLPPEHNEYEHRRQAALSHALSGIEVASRHTDYETSTASYFGSKDNVSEYQGYYSSSQAPDDSSDYRDDCDSEYSHANSHIHRPSRRTQPSWMHMNLGEMSVEV